MPSVQRVGDANSGGGVAQGPGQNNVRINGRPAAVPGTAFTPHPPCGPRQPQHCAGKIATGPNSRTVFANGKPLVLTGSKDSCGHVRQGGSPNVKAV